MPLSVKNYGDVAQPVRACGSYPQCPGFKSLHRHHMNLKAVILYDYSLFLFGGCAWGAVGCIQTVKNVAVFGGQNMTVNVNCDLN